MNNTVFIGIVFRFIVILSNEKFERSLPAFSPFHFCRLSCFQNTKFSKDIRGGSAKSESTDEVIVQVNSFDQSTTGYSASISTSIQSELLK